MCRNQLLGHDCFVTMRLKSFETSFLKRNFWICHIRGLADVTVPWTHFHSHSSALKSSMKAHFRNRPFLSRTEPVSRYLVNNFRTVFLWSLILRITPSKLTRGLKDDYYRRNVSTRNTLSVVYLTILKSRLCHQYEKQPSVSWPVTVSAQSEPLLWQHDSWSKHH
jgi:hypothetical protein